MAPRKILLPHPREDARVTREDRIQPFGSVLGYADGESPAKSRNVISESKSLEQAVQAAASV